MQRVSDKRQYGFPEPVTGGHSAGVLVRPGTRIAAWASQLGPPASESLRSRRMAHIGGIAAITALVVYLTWRVTGTLPAGG